MRLLRVFVYYDGLQNNGFRIIAKKHSAYYIAFIERTLHRYGYENCRVPNDWGTC